MKRSELSHAIGGISDRHIEEAAHYTAPRRRAPIVRTAVAALLALCLLVGIGALAPSGGTAVAAYVYGTDTPLTRAASVLETGTISDSGEMIGHPLQFYLTGEGIARVRFSCERQCLSFTDWTEQRASYANVRNFTIDYGTDAAEYYYLTVDWTPSETIRALTDQADMTLATLPEALRHDRIVLEISFADGSSATKAIDIALQESGAFAAAFDDYAIAPTDDFVRRADALPVSALLPAHEPEDAPAVDAPAVDAPDAEVLFAAARAYYAPTVFTVEALRVTSCDGADATLSARVSRGGVVQEPDRTVWLSFADGAWTVVNEGY